MDKLVRTARRSLGQVGYGELLFFLKEAPHFPWKQTTSKQNIILMITLQLCEANTGKIIQPKQINQIICQTIMVLVPL